MATVAEPAELPSFEPRSRRASDASTAASTATGTIHGASLSPRTGRLAGHVQQKEELPERGCGCISCLPWARHPFFEAAELVGLIVWRTPFVGQLVKLCMDTAQALCSPYASGWEGERCVMHDLQLAILA